MHTSPRHLIIAAALPLAASLVVIMPASSVRAQQAPDAGRTLQELRPRLPQPVTPPAFKLDAPMVESVAPGGPQVAVTSITIDGNSAIPSEQLQALVADAPGRRYDLAGLKTLADRITDHYRGAGYPFARALVPAQTLDGGALRIQVLEGRYGRVAASGELAGQAQPWLSALRPGQVIGGRELERSIYLLSDLPGIAVDPVMGPGSAVGEGDLDVGVSMARKWGGQASVDNYGNRYTGAGRAGLSLWGNSLFTFGDRATLDALLTTEAMWLGALGYEAPVGTSGLRFDARFAHTRYELGKEFSSLDATGRADIAAAGLSYPLWRAAWGGVTAGLQYQHKTLRDNMEVADSHTKASSDSVPLSLRFDARDTLLAGLGGLTYGQLSWTPGKLHLGPTLMAVDQATARSNGSFHKLNLDVARLQQLPANLNLYARFMAQWANKNLHSSESFGLGGQGGVRAYPLGEGYGDAGWLLQTELRYPIGNVTPYGFFDLGRVKVNQDPWAPGENTRTLSGAGFGLRAILQKAWTVDVSLAWRTHGGKPRSDSRDARPLAWASLAYRF